VHLCHQVRKPSLGEFMSTISPSIIPDLNYKRNVKAHLLLMEFCSKVQFLFVSVLFCLHYCVTYINLKYWLANNACLFLLYHSYMSNTYTLMQNDLQNNLHGASKGIFQLLMVNCCAT
jgi:hypothetical protein